MSVKDTPPESASTRRSKVERPTSTASSTRPWGLRLILWWRGLKIWLRNLFSRPVDRLEKRQLSDYDARRAAQPLVENPLGIPKVDVGWERWIAANQELWEAKFKAWCPLEDLLPLPQMVGNLKNVGRGVESWMVTWAMTPQSEWDKEVRKALYPEEERKDQASMENQIRLICLDRMRLSKDRGFLTQGQNLKQAVVIGTADGDVVHWNGTQKSNVPRREGGFSPRDFQEAEMLAKTKERQTLASSSLSTQRTSVTSSVPSKPNTLTDKLLSAVTRIYGVARLKDLNRRMRADSPLSKLRERMAVRLFFLGLILYLGVIALSLLTLTTWLVSLVWQALQ